jgi:hypothetical protein
MPSNIRIGQTFNWTFVLQNLTFHLAELVAFVEASDSFVFAGYKQKAIRILPFSTEKLEFRILAIQPGKVALPLVRIMKRSDAQALLEGGSISKADTEKCFTLCVSELYRSGSKNGELYVQVYPSLSEE